MGLAKVKRSYAARHKGSISRGVPRIYNLDRNKEIVGFAEVNLQATSVFGRVKIHKGFFFCQPSDVAEGDLIKDRLDENRYLVMSCKSESLGYEVIYLDTTLIHCEEIVTVSRFVSGARDTFGRPTTPGPQVIASGVYCMANPKRYDVMQQEDRLLPDNKITFYVQSKVGVKPSDRLTTVSGRSYMVEAVDAESLRNLDILHVDMDER